MRALDLKLLRDLWHLRGQAFAIALVLAAATLGGVYVSLNTPAWLDRVGLVLAAFVGALAASMWQRRPFAQALARANAAAALSVTGRGAIAGMPDAAATARFLRSG